MPDLAPSPPRISRIVAAVSCCTRQRSDLDGRLGTASAVAWDLFFFVLQVIHSPKTRFLPDSVAVQAHTYRATFPNGTGLNLAEIGGERQRFSFPPPRETQLFLEVGLEMPRW